MPVTIRRADAADASIIVEFNSLLAEESEGKTLDRALLTKGVAAALADPHKGPYYLASDGGGIVGQMQITFEFSDWRNGWIWWIQGVYVRPEARKRGVFRSLYEYVAEAARRDPHVIGLRLYVERENLAAQATYKHMGMLMTSYQVMERYPL